MEAHEGNSNLCANKAEYVLRENARQEIFIDKHGTEHSAHIYMSMIEAHAAGWMVWGSDSHQGKEIFQFFTMSRWAVLSTK